MKVFYISHIGLSKEQRDFLKYVQLFHKGLGYVTVQLHLDRNYYTIDEYGRRCANFMDFMRAWTKFTSRDANVYDLLKFGRPVKYLG